MSKQLIVTSKADAIKAIDQAKQKAGEEDMADILDSLNVYYERQYAYVPGRKHRADFALWRPGSPLGERMALVEVTGGVYSKQAHGSITGILLDNARLNLATLVGWRVLRFTPQQVHNGEARDILERLLA